MFQLSLSRFKSISSEIWPRNVSCSHLPQDAPHQSWRAPASFRHLLPSMGGWWSGHTDHNHAGRRAEGQSGDPGGLTIFPPTWCSSNFYLQRPLLLFAAVHARPPWCRCSSSTPAPPSPPRTSSKGSISSKSSCSPGFPGCCFIHHSYGEHELCFCSWPSDIF